MQDFNKIILLKSEKQLLLASKKKPIPSNSTSDHLYRLNLVKPNFTEKKDEFNNLMNDGTYSISDDGLRYIKYNQSSDVKNRNSHSDYR